MFYCQVLVISDPDLKKIILNKHRALVWKNICPDCKHVKMCVCNVLDCVANERANKGNYFYDQHLTVKLKSKL